MAPRRAALRHEHEGHLTPLTGDEHPLPGPSPHDCEAGLQGVGGAHLTPTAWVAA